MRTDNYPLGIFLTEVMRLKKRLPSQMAAELNVSHATVGRWLSGQDIPNVRSCRKLSEYTGISLDKILVITGHLPEVANLDDRDSIMSLLNNLK